MSDEINVKLLDEDRGIHFLFTTYADKPGQIFTSTYVSEDEAEDGQAFYREPLDEEFTVMGLHPLSSRLRFDLIIESARQWESWVPFVENMVDHAFNKPQTDKEIEA